MKSASKFIVVFAAGVLVTLLAYPALDFVQACRVALSSPASATTPPQSGPEPAFAGLDATPADGISTGEGDAPVVVYEFSDFQCPFCAQWASEVKPLLFRDYVDQGKVRFVYIDFPLSIHPNAVQAAIAARCAHDQERFWEFYDYLFASQTQWEGLSDPTPFLLDAGRNLGLADDAFSSCLESGHHRPAVLKGRAYGEEMNVQGTPWLYVNGEAIPGDPISLQAAIEKALSD